MTRLSRIDISGRHLSGCSLAASISTHRQLAQQALDAGKAGCHRLLKFTEVVVVLQQKALSAAHTVRAAKQHAGRQPTRNVPPWGRLHLAADRAAALSFWICITSIGLQTADRELPGRIGQSNLHSVYLPCEK